MENVCKILFTISGWGKWDVEGKMYWRIYSFFILSSTRWIPFPVSFWKINSAIKKRSIYREKDLTSTRKLTNLRSYETFNSKHVIVKSIFMTWAFKCIWRSRRIETPSFPCDFLKQLSIKNKNSLLPYSFLTEWQLHVFVALLFCFYCKI